MLKELGRKQEGLTPPSCTSGFSSDCEVASPKLWLSASLAHLRSHHPVFEAWSAAASRLDFSSPDLGFFFLLTSPSS